MICQWDKNDLKKNANASLGWKMPNIWGDEVQCRAGNGGEYLGSTGRIAWLGIELVMNAQSMILGKTQLNNDLTVLPHQGEWLVRKILPKSGPTFQVSELYTIIICPECYWICIEHLLVVVLKLTLFAIVGSPQIPQNVVDWMPSALAELSGWRWRDTSGYKHTCMFRFFWGLDHEFTVYPTFFWSPRSHKGTMLSYPGAIKCIHHRCLRGVSIWCVLL